MNIVIGYPPNYKKISQSLPMHKGIIFCYGDTLYNPDNGLVDEHIIRHEETHTRQQGRSVDKWWDRYLESIDFRLSQEVEAYQNQYKSFCKEYKDRNVQNLFLVRLANYLSGEMYGKILSQQEALQAIKAQHTFKFIT